jgi:hypothetical protein
MLYAPCAMLITTPTLTIAHSRQGGIFDSGEETLGLSDRLSIPMFWLVWTRVKGQELAKSGREV